MASAWLIKIEAGTVWRFATTEIDYDGHRWSAGLDDPGSFVNTVSLTTPEARSVQFSVSPGHIEDFPIDDIAMGAKATIYYWPDTSTGAPEVVVDGAMQDPVYGGQDEPITATVQEFPWEDTGRIPNRLAKIDSTSWPDFRSSVGIAEEWYPIIIGEPSAGPNLVGSPAYYVDTTGTHYVLIAGHRVVATAVNLYDSDAGTLSTSASVVEMADGRGSIVSVIDATSLSVGTRPFTKWSAGGGLPNPEKPSKALTGAGDLIEWMLRRSSLRVDWGRFRATKHALNTYRIDCYIQPEAGSRLSPWDWVQSELLSLLPVEVRQSSDGLYLALFDPTRPVSESPVSLVAGGNCERISQVTALSGAVANDITLVYAPFADSAKGSQRVTVTGSDVVLAEDPDALPSALCAESVRRFGVKSKEVPTSVIYDTATATKIALGMAAREAMPPLEVAYSLDDLEWLRELEPGQRVSLSDTSLTWSGRSAQVWSVNVGPVREVVLRLWP